MTDGAAFCAAPDRGPDPRRNGTQDVNDPVSGHATRFAAVEGSFTSWVPSVVLSAQMRAACTASFAVRATWKCVRLRGVFHLTTPTPIAVATRVRRVDKCRLSAAGRAGQCRAVPSAREGSTGVLGMHTEQRGETWSSQVLLGS